MDNQPKIALVFPGQGSQVVGMGKVLADNFFEARYIFQEVDDILKDRLSHLIFEGSLEDLTRTDNCQPALMTVSMAIIEVMKSLGIKLHEFSYAAGHSLGEYSALAAVGSLSIGNAALLLRNRGLAMQKAVPVGEGGMLAVIGGTTEDVEKIAQECSAFGICELANDNAPGQIILSGQKTALDQVLSIAEGYGIRKVIPLNVSAPFHCSLMGSAAAVMEKFLENVTFQKPIMPVVNNVTAQSSDDPIVLKNLLVPQITGRVKWRESILYMKEKGVSHVIEAGPGKVLAGLIKRIDPDMQVSSIHTPTEITECFKQLGKI